MISWLLGGLSWLSSQRLGAFILALAQYFAMPAAATLLGAWLAFRLESSRERQRGHEQARRNIASVLFALYCRRNHLAAVENEALNRWRSNPAKAYLMPPTSDYATVPQLDLNGIITLFPTFPAIIDHVQRAESLFQIFRGAMTERSPHHREFQRKMEQQGLEPGTQVSLEHMRKMAGPALTAQLEGATAQVYELHAQASLAAKKAYDAVDAHWRKTYPKRELPRMIDSSGMAMPESE